MGFFAIILLGLAVSMDAFAVALIQGLCATHDQEVYALKVGLFFGLFQALMTFLGYVLGQSFSSYITAYDHWVSFILLSGVGLKMIIDGFQAKDFSCEVYPEDDLKKLILYAFMTSIDALAVGVSLAFIITNIKTVSFGIGIITFTTSALGVLLGKRFAFLLENKAEFFGGFVLIALGVNILIQHLF